MSAPVGPPANHQSSVGSPPDPAHRAAPQVADALNHGAQPAPHAAVTPPGLSVSQDNSSNKARKMDAGQIAWNAIKLVGLVAVSPVALYAGIFYMLGFTASAMAGSSRPGEFKEYMSEGLINVFSPVIEIGMGIHQGIQGHPVEEEEEKAPEVDSNSPPAAPVAPAPAQQPGVGQAEERRVMQEAERPPEHAEPAAGGDVAAQAAEVQRRQQQEAAEEQARREAEERNRNAGQPPL